jgi:hypothetical protein
MTQLIICPFLGLEEDPLSVLEFSSDRNFCYLTEKPTPVLSVRQQKYCLTPEHPDCPVFRARAHLSVPGEIRPAPPRRSLRGLIWAALVILISLGILAASWLGQSGRFAFGGPELTRTLTPEKSNLPIETSQPQDIQTRSTATLQPTRTLKPSPAPTGTPSPTLTASLPLGLETPVGIRPRLLLHRAVPGDNLALLAERYGTSVDAIRSINYFLPLPLWEGAMVVIPFKTMDVSDLATFEAYQVEEGTLTLEETAWALNTSPELVSRYNLLDPKTIPQAGSWLIIPRPLPPPTGLPLATQDGKIEK